MAGTHRNLRSSRTLSVGLALVASGAMLAGSSALAWPSLKGYLTPPAVSSTVPALFAPAATALAQQSTPPQDRPATQAFIAETLVQVADDAPAPAQRPDRFEPPQRGIAARGDSAPTYFLGTSVASTQSTGPQGNGTQDNGTPGRQSPQPGFRDQASTLPNDGSDTATTPAPQARPRVATPRQPVARAPMLRTSAEVERARGRLEGHWSVGKFR